MHSMRSQPESNYLSPPVPPSPPTPRMRMIRWEISKEKKQAGYTELASHPRKSVTQHGDRKGVKAESVGTLKTMLKGKRS